MHVVSHSAHHPYISLSLGYAELFFYFIAVFLLPDQRILRGEIIHLIHFLESRFYNTKSYFKKPQIYWYGAELLYRLIRQILNNKSHANQSDKNYSTFGLLGSNFNQSCIMIRAKTEQISGHNRQRRLALIANDASG